MSGPTSADHLFPSEDEYEEQQTRVKHVKDSSSASSSSRSGDAAKRSASKSSHPDSKKKKLKTMSPTVHPISPVMKPQRSDMKTTSHDLFGSDSDDDREEIAASNLKGNKKITPLYSYFTRRVANGLSRQTDELKQGPYYIELKIYDVKTIEHVAPINRWRHSIISIKNRTENNTPAWARLKDFIDETRREFKNCPLEFVSSYY
ncbi:uncharacterized protein LOC124633463 [Helicoverpa zea]|uniref:uncharacterized protein LOC124633463 n=1 Tax=Helicoverpa zea TaxID=7113 RepID=UPI001F563B61|nr:uncharacterized protein LOC124632371 isoform X2 [Helicoverpa zea]XP_047024648.1 uncharacterized protein LOC124633463 [Helicoverpa zea]